MSYPTWSVNDPTILQHVEVLRCRFDLDLVNVVSELCAMLHGATERRIRSKMALVRGFRKYMPRVRVFYDCGQNYVLRDQTTKKLVSRIWNAYHLTEMEFHDRTWP